MALVISVPPGSPVIRLDIFVADAAHCSRRLVQRAIEAGEVRVNGRRAHKGTMLSAGDEVAMAESLGQPQFLEPNPGLEVSILYEDPALIAVDKPAGMPSHALRASEAGSVANFLLARFPELRNLEERPLEAGAVHRLDTETSGVLLVGRTAPAYRGLREQFRKQEIEKEYRAVVYGDVSRPGEISVALVHDRRDSGKMRVATPGMAKRSRAAATSYKPLRRFGDFTLLAVHMRTGVMHQIRVHLASIGHPIAGDRRYGHAPSMGSPARHLLHAFRLNFRHPATGQPMQVTAPVPDDFAAFLREVEESKL